MARSNIAEVRGVFGRSARSTLFGRSCGVESPSHCLVDQLGHGDEVGFKVVRQRLENALVRRQEGRRRHHDGVAVRCRFRHHRNANPPRVASPVVHHEGLAQFGGQLLANLPSHHVYAATGRQRNNDLDRAAGVDVLRERRGDEG